MVTRKWHIWGLPQEPIRKNKNCCSCFKYLSCYDERPLKIAEQSQKVVSAIKWCNQIFHFEKNGFNFKN